MPQGSDAVAYLQLEETEHWSHGDLSRCTCRTEWSLCMRTSWVPNAYVRQNRRAPPDAAVTPLVDQAGSVPVLDIANHYGTVVVTPVVLK